MDGGSARTAKAPPAVKPPQGMSVGALDKRLHIKKRARDDAARNLPRQDDIQLSAAESAIIEAVGSERARVDQQRHDARADAERRLRTLAPQPQDFAGPALDARLSLKQTAGRVAHDWNEAAERAAQGRADLDAFKRTHELRRAAVYPKSTLLQTGMLFCAAVFEALFSAALFAEEDERGLLGGAITAIGLSGANVTLGYLAGFLGLRYLQHRHLPMKAIGASFSQHSPCSRSCSICSPPIGAISLRRWRGGKSIWARMRVSICGRCCSSIRHNPSFC